ncbi:ABC transporter permease [Chloroflexales bacterium ZM16-3]|nr:ABC transporter permease [Chloroflexales bacterium ZM16-3]
MLSLKNLWRRKTRTLLTTLGIAVGVAAVVVLSALGNGMADGFGAIGASTDADLLVSQKDAVMIIVGAIDESVGDEIRQMRGVSAVAGTTVGIVQMPESPYFLVAGEDPRGFAIGRYKIIAGRQIASKREVMLGRQSAENLKKTVGDKFRINDISYRVAGIYETGQSFEDNGAVIGLEDAQRTFDKRRQVSYFKLQLDDPSYREAVRAEIESRWTNLGVTRSGEATSQDEMLKIYRSMGWVLGVFAILVGGLGMMNAMLMSVFERTREIGVLRAMGWRRWRVVRMILGEALIQSIIGGLIGLALGAGTIALARQAPAVAGLLSHGMDPATGAQAFVVALVLGLVGGGYPAWRAAQLAPLEAMRSESGAAVTLGPVARLLSRVIRFNAARNLLRRPARTLMTVLGLGLGVGFVIALSGIVEGSKTMITSLLSAGQADIIIEQANASDSMFSAIDERIVSQLRLDPAVKSLSGLVFGTTTVPGLPFFIVYGLDPRENYAAHYTVQEGRPLQRPGELILGRLAANSLKKSVGDSLRFGGGSFEIVGIFETGAAFEDAGAVIPLREAQRIFGKQRQVSFVGITLHDSSQADAVARSMEQHYPDIMASPTADLTERMQDFATTTAAMNGLMALMVLVGGIVMMNVMMMSVFERTQEIGVLRALGWGRRRILGTVLGESLTLCVVSAVAGAGLGMLLNWLFTLVPDYGGMLTPSYSPATFGLAVAMSLSLGVIGGLLPAWRAVRLSPLEALRYE